MFVISNDYKALYSVVYAPFSLFNQKYYVLIYLIIFWIITLYYMLVLIYFINWLVVKETNKKLFLSFYWTLIFVTHRRQSTNVYHEPQIFHYPQMCIFLFVLCKVISTKIRCDLQIRITYSVNTYFNFNSNLRICGSICTHETGFQYLWIASCQFVGHVTLMTSLRFVPQQICRNKTRSKA